MDIKQYILNQNGEGRYTYYIYKFINGELRYIEGLHISELCEVLESLEKEGYTRAYYEKELAQKIKEAQRNLQDAIDSYNTKQSLFIKFKDEEEEKKYQEASFYREDI